MFFKMAGNFLVRYFCKRWYFSGDLETSFALLEWQSIWKIGKNNFDNFWWDKSFENQMWRKRKDCQVANKAAEFVRLLSVSWNSRGDAATSWSHDRRFGLWDIELSVCRVSDRKCGRFVSSISLKSMQRMKAWKGTLRLRAYNESLLQQIGNSDHQW